MEVLLPIEWLLAHNDGYGGSVPKDQTMSGEQASRKGRRIRGDARAVPVEKCQRRIAWRRYAQN